MIYMLGFQNKFVILQTNTKNIIYNKICIERILVVSFGLPMPDSR